jgi:TolA-binding protein
MTMTASTTEFDFSVGDPISENPPVPGRWSRGLTRYVLAICIALAATLAWQAYSQATKRAPDLEWLPGAKLMIASSLEQLGWTKLAGAENTGGRPAVLESTQAATVAQTAPDKVSIDQQQLRQIAQDVAALGQVLEQVAASQKDMAAEIHNLLVTDMEMFLKIPASSPAPTSSRKSTQVVPASSPARASPRKSTPAAAPSRAADRHTAVRSADVRFRG